MLIFLVFCVTIGIVHGDDSFRIGVSKLNSTTESSLWTLFLLFQLHFTMRHSEIFNDFHTSWNKEDAYLILKTQISNVITLQPHFESIKEIIKFRKSKKREIKDYREQIANLENILKTDCRENAIKVAINNVKSANEALIKNTACKTAARLATYLSVPTSIIELLTFNTSFSILIGIVGAFTQIGADLSDKKNKWIFVAR